MNAALLALLFLPDPAALDWAAFQAAVSSAPHRFTVALSAEETPATQRAWLKEAAAAGRLELALRLPKDPLLPLLARHSPAAMAEGLAGSRAAFRAAFGREPSGFVAGGALLDEASLNALRPLGFAWTAAGPGTYSRPWRAGPTLLAVPLSRNLAEEPATGRLVGAGVPELRAALAAGRWTTVTEAADLAVPFGIAPAAWPAWDGAEDWLGSTSTAKAVAYFAAASEALTRFQGSGRARFERLERAADALRAAASAANFRPGAPPDQLASAVASVYKGIGEAPPGLDGEAPGRVSASVLARGVEFENPDGSTVPWRPLRLRVERSGDDVAVTIQGTTWAVVGLYIDLNGRPGIGSTRLMGGRREAVRGRDAWEIAALVASGAGALWRVGARTPSRIEDLPVAVEGDELRLTLPGNRLRGNPSGWGFLLVTSDERGEGAAALLGTVEDQKRLSAGSPPPVLKAVRLLER